MMPGIYAEYAADTSCILFRLEGSLGAPWAPLRFRGTPAADRPS